MSASGKAPQPNTRRRKRLQPAVFSSMSSSFQDKDSDYLCPVCFDIIEEAHMTKCGHSFCYKCIIQSLDQSNKCPKCNTVLEKPEQQIFPNFHLNELILKQKHKQSDKRFREDNHANGLSPAISHDTLLEQDSLSLNNVNYLLDILVQKKHQLEADSLAAQNQMLKEFLVQVKQKKQEQLNQLAKQVKVLEEDLAQVEARLGSNKYNFPVENGPIPNGVDPTINSTESASHEGFNSSRSAGKQWLYTTMASRRKKINQHFDDLEQCYFSIRERDVASSSASSSAQPAEKPCSGEGLDEFTESLSKFTRFSTFRPLATLSYASDIYNTSSIVSSIEFDRDCDYFAIAGVTKKIKVFEFGTVIREAVDVHYPVNEMACSSKISSIIWSSYHKNMLASSDYEGTVTLWDAFVGAKTKVYQEHEKRCWSLDFNKMDPKLLASGSDDSKVKLWYTNMEHSVASIEAKANVCCVKFNPESKFHLAFGSADHCVHYYDLRNPKTAVMVFKGHRKAVSYAKFVSSSEVVSASTDSQLKLWNVNKPHCLRTFRGHSNEKNFVGLATDGDYIACGSENNSLYVYYKGLSKQLMTFKFDTVRSVLEKDKKEEDTNEFVSAVCWRPGSNVLLAANSQGTIKVLELV